MRLRVVTTHGEYSSVVPDEVVSASGKTTEALSDDLADIIGGPDDKKKTLTIKADNIGWVAVNPRYVVAIEVTE